LSAIFQSVPVLALSGTLTVSQMKKLSEILGLKDSAVVPKSPDKDNNITSRKNEQLGFSFFL